LTKSDLQLDELLDEDGLILEVKNHNQSLYEFILREDNFKELISCAISIPDAENNQNNAKKLYKYPFTCADILSSDSQPIVSEFFKSTKEIKENTPKPAQVITDDDDEVNIEGDSLEKTATSTEGQATEDEKDTTPEANEFPYLDHLFSFLDSESLNLTSAGYFAKVVNNLLSKRTSELISYIYERKPEILQKMIQHIYSKSIAEFLAKVLTFESSVLVNTQNEVYNEKRSEVLKEIIKKLQPECDIEEINNTAYLICEVFGKYNTMHCSHEILQNLLEKPSIDYFFTILKTQKSTSACAVALILGNIFAYYILINTPKSQDQNLDDSTGENTSPTNAPQVFELSDEIPLLAAFIENLDEIVKFIGNSSGDPITGQYGSEAIPFGSARLKALELIIIAMKANNTKIYNQLVDCQFLETILNIFVKHNWNNMLHNQVEKILTHIIEGNSEELKVALYEKAKLFDFIVDSSQDSEFPLSGPHGRKVRKGYLGHLVRLSNKLVESRDPAVLKYTEENEKWKAYTEGLLAETNKRDRVNFGGRDPRAVTPEEDVRLELPSFMHKFARFLNTNTRNQQNQNEEEKKEEDEEEEEEEIEEIEDVEPEGAEGHDEETPVGQLEHQEHQEHHHQVVVSDEFIQETEKHTLACSSPKNQEEELTKQATVPIRGRNSFDPSNSIIPEYEEKIKEEIESHYLLEPSDIRTVEENLDPNFHTNVFWGRKEMSSLEDVLSDIEGL